MSPETRSQRRPRKTLDVVATVAFIVLCLVFVWHLLKTDLGNSPTSMQASQAVPRVPVRPIRRPEPPPPVEPVSIAGAALKGSSEAKVVVIEYSDLQCPFCGVFARNTLPAIEREYVDTGKVRLAFRHLPLETLHPFAMPAAESAQCAGRQGKFWEMQDRLFADQMHLDSASLMAQAKALKLNLKAFSACLKGEAAATVQEDAASAKALGVTGTPTFFVGVVQADGRVKVSERLSGAVSIVQFKAALEKLLAAAPSLTDTK